MLVYFFVGSHSIRKAVRSLFRKFAELLNETHYGLDFINHQTFEMGPSCPSATVLYTLLSGQILKTADGNGSVCECIRVCHFFLDTAGDETTRSLRSRNSERGNFVLTLHSFLLCRGIKPNVISQGEKK